MDLELKRKVINVKLDGQSYPLTVPTLREADELREKSKQAEKSGDEVGLLIDFLSKRGMPKDIVESLEVDHVQKITEAILGVKKN